MSAGAEDTELWQADSLRVVVLREGDEGDVVTVVVDGRLDQSGAERFRSCVMEALGLRPAMLAVDATDLTSVDSPGMAGLLRVRHAVTDAGVAFGLSGASPALRRVAEDAGFETLLPDE
jgi:anti-anti-sigma factor